MDKIDTRRVRRAASPVEASFACHGVKPRRTAAQLHDMVRDRLLGLGEGGGTTQPLPSSELELGLPYPHPVDALGRNWNIAEVRGLRARQVAPARLVIDGLREAFDLEGG